MTLEEFAKSVMSKRGITGFVVESTYGDEGFCDSKNKKILLGENTSKKVVLHEMAHILAGETAYHYSEPFESAYAQLCDEFLVTA
jgi:hypothetical protein